MTHPVVDIIEYTDPVCSWAWGSEPKLRLLRWRYEDRANWRRVMGGLVGDGGAGKPDWDRARAAERMSDYWKRVFVITGQSYPKPMRLMLRSTDPAGRAVKAAELQGEAVAARVLRRLRESIFIFGVGPQTAEEFTIAAAGVPGLDVPRWLTDMASEPVAAAYQADWAETRDPNAYVRELKDEAVGNGSLKHSEGRDRYAFPTLIFRGPGGEHTVPGWAHFEAYVDAMEAAAPGSTANPRPGPTPAQAFERWASLTAKEVEVILGANAIPPADAVAHHWGDGLIYFSAAEAAAHGLALQPA
jgi:protein-disulfide isomerase-like protein with CxxC motif